MAHSFSTNTVPANGSLAMYLLLSTLITAGWTKDKDSDGTTYSAGGTQITSGASGANGLANNRAWFVMTNPLGRSFCFQRSTTLNTDWRVKYSYAAGFVGGTPGATQTPSATDEVTISGGGTDAAPTFFAIFATDGTHRFNVIAGDSTVGYACAWISWLVGVPAPAANTRCMVHEVMATGSFPPGDVDPTAFYLAGNGSGGNGAFAYADFYYLLSNSMKCNFKNGASQIFQIVSTYTNYDPVYASRPIVWQGGTGLGQHPISGKDGLLPIPWARPQNVAAPYGIKGQGLLMRAATTLRASGDTLSVDATRDWLYINGTCFPWDGSVPLL